MCGAAHSGSGLGHHLNSTPTCTAAMAASASRQSDGQQQESADKAARRERGEQAQHDDDPVGPALQQAQRAGHEFAPDLRRVGDAKRRRRPEGSQNAQGFAVQRRCMAVRVPRLFGGCKLPLRVSAG